VSAANATIHGEVHDPQRKFAAIFRIVWPALLVFGLAVLDQVCSHLHDDVSWLITAGEEILDGKTAYVDFLETNPPAAILIYLPPIIAARISGATPEFMVGLFCFVGIAASIALSAFILRHAKLNDDWAPFRLAGAVAVLGLLPANTFAQREHIALIVALPFFATLAAQARGDQISTPLKLLVGFGAGVTAAIKPYFALMILATLPYFISRVGWRAAIVSAQFYAAAAILLAHAAITVLFFPAYLDRIAPIVFAVYTAVGYSWYGMLGSTAVKLWFVLGAYLAIMARSKLREPLVATMALASAGAMLAYFVQRRDFPYQALPAIALIALAFVTLPESTEANRQRVGIAHGLFLAILGISPLVAAWLWFNQAAPPFSFETKAAALTPHPRVLAIADNLNTFPFIRRIGGVWVQRTNFLWITMAAQIRIAQSGRDPAVVEKMQPYLRLDREMLIEDINRNRPDIILITENRNTKLRDWAFSEPQFAAALNNYRVYDYDASNETFLYARNDLVSTDRTFKELPDVNGATGAANVR
jgi:hypothetical protein